MSARLYSVKSMISNGGSEAKFRKTASGVADALLPFTEGEWNRMHGAFTVTQEMVEAESAAFYFDGVIGGIEIMLDNSMITQNA